MASRGYPQADGSLQRLIERARNLFARPCNLRGGACGASHDFAVSDDCLEGVRRTAALLESLGHRVEEVEIPELHSADLGRGMVAVMSNAVALDIERWQAELGRPPEDDEIEPLNRLFWEMGRVQTGTAYVEGVEALHRYGRGLAPFFHGSARDAEGFDLLVTPTVTAPPPQIGELSPDVEARTLLARLGQLTPYTTPFDATGQPAISLPMHWSEEGLPIGVQLVARYGREDVLFRVAAQLEEAQPWRDRHPPDPATRNLP